MTDLTVLVSPIPLYPEARDFTFGRRPKPPHTRPIMVTLETEIEEADRAPKSPVDEHVDKDFINPPSSPPRRSRTPRIVEPHLLSPPVNTWKARPRHRPTRSHSAPPERRTPAPGIEEQPEREPVRFNTEALGFRQRNPNRSFTSFSTVDRNTTRGGELVRPPPPLSRGTEADMGADSQSFYYSSITSVPVVPTNEVAKRQTGVNALTAPTLASFTSDYWPFPPSDVSLLPTTTSSSIIPILISLISAVPSTSNSDARTTASSSSISQSHNSALSTSSTPQSSSTTTAVLSTTKTSFKLIELVPAFGVVGVFLLGLGLWVLYGCCTRKPRILKDDGELICGPPYVGLHDSDNRRDVENWGQNDMASLHKYGQGDVGAQYRWPSYSEPPASNQKAVFYKPDQCMGDHDHNEGEDIILLSASLAAPAKSVHAPSFASTTQLAGPSCRHEAVSRQHSSATSAALVELYESDSDEDVRRRAQEPPWESLRHKSIKRGILEQVKKDNTWMDSVRSSLMGVGVSGTSISDAGPKRRESESKSTREEMDMHVSSSKAQNGIGRRRGHVRAESDIHIGTMRDGGSEEMSERTHRQHRLNCSEAVVEDFTRKSDGVVTKPQQLARGRRSYAWLKDEESQDRFTPLPARLNSSCSRSPNRSERRSRSRSRSRSTSPVKRPVPWSHAPITRPIDDNNTHPLPHSGEGDGSRGEGYITSARAVDILPQSPPQIMSPPLESQICFTSIPRLDLNPMGGAAKVNAPHQSSRGESTSLTKISSPKKRAGKPRDNSRSRSRHRSTTRSAESSAGFPFPMNDFPVASPFGSVSATKDASWTGPRRQKSSPKKADHIQRAPGRDRTISPRPAHGNMPKIEVGTETIMQRVDHIMEAGWSERDLGLEGIHCLSPTGFGRDA